MNLTGTHKHFLLGSRDQGYGILMAANWVTGRGKGQRISQSMHRGSAPTRNGCTYLMFPLPQPSCDIVVDVDVVVGSVSQRREMLEEVTHDADKVDITRTH